MRKYILIAQQSCSRQPQPERRLSHRQRRGGINEQRTRRREPLRPGLRSVWAPLLLPFRLGGLGALDHLGVVALALHQLDDDSDLLAVMCSRPPWRALKRAISSRCSRDQNQRRSRSALMILIPQISFGLPHLKRLGAAGSAGHSKEREPRLTPVETLETLETKAQLSPFVSRPVCVETLETLGTTSLRCRPCLHVPFTGFKVAVSPLETSWRTHPEVRIFLCADIARDQEPPLDRLSGGAEEGFALRLRVLGRIGFHELMPHKVALDGSPSQIGGNVGSL